jgi:hypothetical protein
MTYIIQKIAKPKIALLGVLLFCAVAIGISFLGNQRAAALALPAPTTIADITDKCDKGFLGLKPWYHFMPNELGVPKQGSTPADRCGVRCFNLFVQAQPNECGQTQSDIPGIILAIIDDLLRIAGLVAVAFIIIGSFQYVGSRGNAERTAQAQSTVISALTGLIVALVAVAFVSFLGKRLT